VQAERIFHVSETAAIDRFEPRIDSQGRERVWAIGDSRLHNYLLPRDCPRVTYYANAATTTEDRRAFLATSDARSVVAIEQAWFAALRDTHLHVYEFDPSDFVLDDAIAAYYVSANVAIPIGCREVVDLPRELFRRAVELRLLPSLWPLHDAVVASSLAFSIIRMRNAQARDL
jgi:Family of unknown function (DUF6886)